MRDSHHSQTMKLTPLSYLFSILFENCPRFLLASSNFSLRAILLILYFLAEEFIVHTTRFSLVDCVPYIGFDFVFLSSLFFSILLFFRLIHSLNLSFRFINYYRVNSKMEEKKLPSNVDDISKNLHSLFELFSVHFSIIQFETVIKIMFLVCIFRLSFYIFRTTTTLPVVAEDDERLLLFFHFFWLNVLNIYIYIYGIRVQCNT